MPTPMPARHELKPVGPSDFVKQSETFIADGQYLNSTCPCSTRSRAKWWIISICIIISDTKLRQVDAAPTPGALLASVLRGLGDEYAMTIAVLQHSDQQHTVDTVLPHLLTRETDLLGRTGEQAFTAVQQQWGAPVQQQAFAAQMQQQWGAPVQQQAFDAQMQQQWGPPVQ